MSDASVLGYTKDDAKSVKKAQNSPVAKVPVEKAVEVESYVAPSVGGTPKMTKVVVIFKQQKLQDFIQAMEKIDITGITVTNVMGCGMQSGQTNYYRGTSVEMNLLPKLKAEIAVCAVPVERVISATKAALYTGHYGDGKYSFTISKTLSRSVQVKRAMMLSRIWIRIKSPSVCRTGELCGAPAISASLF